MNMAKKQSKGKKQTANNARAKARKKVQQARNMGASGEV